MKTKPQKKRTTIILRVLSNHQLSIVKGGKCNPDDNGDDQSPIGGGDAKNKM